jgi:proline iminopeptidase
MLSILNRAFGLFVPLMGVVLGCAALPAARAAEPAPAVMQTGGVQIVTIQTSRGPFKVWTKKVGQSPRIKVLLLHGGPGATHEYFEAMESFLPGAGIEFYYYDQLGSAFSDQPDEPSLVDLSRYVDEVEQVRQALKLDRSNFYLLGHSWGGILAIEYALKYPQQLKGLVVSNMVASIPEYNRYAKQVLMPAMDPAALQQILALEQAGKYEDPQYESLLMAHFYQQHILRRPPDQWPDPVVRSFARLNKKIYIPMQGPSEMGASGKLEKWDRTADLHRIATPTLVIAGRHDTMEPAQMQRMATRVAHGRYLLCPQGSHMAMYDDQQVYMRGLIRFLKDVDARHF